MTLPSPGLSPLHTLFQTSVLGGTQFPVSGLWALSYLMAPSPPLPFSSVASPHHLLATRILDSGYLGHSFLTPVMGPAKMQCSSPGTRSPRPPGPLAHPLPPYGQGQRIPSAAHRKPLGQWPASGASGGLVLASAALHDQKRG